MNSQTDGLSVAANENVAAENNSAANPVFDKNHRKELKSVSYSKYGYMFVAPFFIVFLIFQIYPIIYSLGISFTSYSGTVESSYVGFQNYSDLLLGKLSYRFLISIANTLIIWLINFIPQIVASFLFAAIFTSATMKVKGSGAFKVIFYMPSIIMATSVAVTFKQLTTYPGGLLDNILKHWGVISDPSYNIYRDVWGSRLLISFIQFWRYTGYTMITLCAGMLGINPTFYEAATIDGASKTRSFFSITIPLLRPIVLYTLVTSLVGGLQMFEIPFLLTEGFPALEGGALATETVAVYIYQFAFGHGYGNEYAIASAASGYLFVISAVLTFIVFRFFGKEAFGIERQEKSAKGEK